MPCRNVLYDREQKFMFCSAAAYPKIIIGERRIPMKGSGETKLEGASPHGGGGVSSYPSPSANPAGEKGRRLQRYDTAEVITECTTCQKPR